MKIHFIKYVTWYLVFAMFILGITPHVDAAFSPSEAIALTNFDRSADIEKLQRFLEMKVVKDRLEKFGFMQDEIMVKLDQLSDEQLHQLSLKIDDLRVGGNGLEIVAAFTAIAILVVILIWLTGHRVIVK